MFVAFVVGCVLVLFNILVVGLLVKNDADLRMFAVATFTVRGMVGIVEIFAVFYLPLRWRRIMQEPTAYKVLGLVGGFGLIFLLFCEGLLLLSSLAESAAS